MSLLVFQGLSFHVRFLCQKFMHIFLLPAYDAVTQQAYKAKFYT